MISSIGKVFFITWAIILGAQAAASEEHSYADLALKTYHRFLQDNPSVSKNSQYAHKTTIGCLLNNVKFLPPDLAEKYIRFLGESLDLAIASKSLKNVAFGGRSNIYFNKIKLFHSKTEACMDEIPWSFKLSKSNESETPMGYKWGQKKSYIDFFEPKEADGFKFTGIPYFFYFWDALMYPSKDIGNKFKAERHFSFYNEKLAEVSYQGILKEEKYHPDDYEEVTKNLVKKYGEASRRNSKTKSLVGYLLPDSFSDILGMLDKTEMFISSEFVILHGVRTDGDLTFRYINHYISYINTEMMKVRDKDSETKANNDESKQDKKLFDNL